MKMPIIQPILDKPEHLVADDIAISVKNLTKKYRIFGHPSDRIKQALTFGRVRFHREFIALQDVSFEIRKGETVGIIGRNGSGKSTLLQLICGILKPTSGTVQTHGRISALLELGSGFNPDFTGRENVYFQGAITGISKEGMDARFDDIAAFADIGEFINQPVRTYSSGMFVRLAFAVAVHVEPDILVIDEALSVGDFIFQSKCHARIRELQKMGVAILLVGHSFNLITSLCDKALLLEQGKQNHFGKVADVISSYESLCIKRENISPAQHNGHGSSISLECKSPMEILDVETISGDGSHRVKFQQLEPISVLVRYRTSKQIETPCFGISIRSVEGVILWSTTSLNTPWESKSIERGAVSSVLWKCNIHMGSGFYLIAIGIGEVIRDSYRRFDHWHDAAEIEVLQANKSFGSGLLYVENVELANTENFSGK